MENTEKNTYKHGLICAACLGICLVVFSLSAPVSAQMTPTVTPIPAPVATATAAAVRVQQAQAQAQEADKLQAQAEAAQRAAQAAYQQAQADAVAAREALAAQQYQQAGEALGRAEMGVATGKQNLDALSASYAALNGIVATQANTITLQAAELMQCRADVKRAGDAYVATAAKLQDAEDNATNPVLNIAIGLLFVGLIAVIVVVVIEKWRQPRVIAAHSDVIDADATEVHDVER